MRVQAVDAPQRRLQGDHLGAEPGDDQRRIIRIYEFAYGRKASDTELEADRKLLMDVEQASTEQDVAKRRLIAWNTLCHVVLAANEFIYLK